VKVVGIHFHGYLDFLIVAAFFAAPTLGHLSGLAASISYGLAITQLALALVTDFPLGVYKLVPTTLHSALELVVAVTLIGLPWILGDAADGAASNFYIGAGGGLLVVWLLTDYHTLDQPRPLTPSPRSEAAILRIPEPPKAKKS
jgi:hypothetical protein